MARSHLFARWSARLVAWRRGRGFVVHGQPPPGDLHIACDRLFLRVADARQWEELRDCATELRFLTLHAERLVEAAAIRVQDNCPEIQAATSALASVREELLTLTPAPRRLPCSHPAIAARRNTLYEALRHLRYALIVLGWARLATPRDRIRSG